MITNPVLSIVTVCYNAQNCIEKTLQSAINQSYKNFELVIIDGNSTDNTLEKINKFKPYIGKLISESDKGIYDAMNKGIKAAKGNWIYFLNAGDEFYSSTILEEIFNNKTINNNELLYGKIQTINEPTGVNYVNGSAIVLNDFYARYPINHQATFTSKIAFEKIGLFNIKYRLAADLDWFVRYFKTQNNKAIFIDKIIALYDIQGASYTKRMAGYREYLSIGLKQFPIHITIKNTLLYPLMWLKVKLIRALTNTAFFKAYRKRKFANKLATTN